MQHMRDADHRLIDRFRIADVALHDLQIWKRRKIAALPRSEIIQHPDLCPVGQQCLNPNPAIEFPQMN